MNRQTGMTLHERGLLKHKVIVVNHVQDQMMSRSTVGKPWFFESFLLRGMVICHGNHKNPLARMKSQTLSVVYR